VDTTPSAVRLVVLDVNETLLPLDPVAARLTDVGLDGQLELWFTRILRDGCAAAAAGTFVGFGDLARHHLIALLRTRERPVSDGALTHVLDAFDELVPHPDVAEGLGRLREVGVPAVALTNGSAAVATAALERGGLRELVSGVHDVAEVGRWKPAPDPYLHVLERRNVAAADAVMVASHPWDLLGAGAVGMRTAWLDRGGATWPAPFDAPDVHAADLATLVERLLPAP
jgi:2-haloacid dehalogenase